MNSPELRSTVSPTTAFIHVYICSNFKSKQTQCQQKGQKVYV